jgi:hypothetical protein
MKENWLIKEGKKVEQLTMRNSLVGALDES